MSVVTKVISFLKQHDPEMKISFRSDCVETLPHCVSVRAVLHGAELNAWGVDESLDLATIKAVMELYERFVFIFVDKPDSYRMIGSLSRRCSLDDISKKYGVPTSSWLGNTSSGFSAHTSIRNAVGSGINEIIERHTLLKAELFGIVPRKCIGNKLNDSFETYIYPSLLGRVVAVTKVVINGKIAFGFGCDLDEEVAVKKSIGEVVPRFYFLRNQNGKIDFNNMHVLANLNAKESRLSNLLENATCSMNEINHVDKQISKKDFFYALVSNSPFPVVRVVCPLLQPHFLGEWGREKINSFAFLQTPKNMPFGLHAVG